MTKQIISLVLLVFALTSFSQQNTDKLSYINGNVVINTDLDLIKQNKRERIILFYSNISINDDGKIIVTENIIVHANGDQIKRGIVRRIPIYRKDKFGKNKKLETQFLSVLCNGENVKIKEDIENENLTIYIGDPNIFLESGIYKYEITYVSYGQIGFFDEFDELYWNVTGNDWELDIEHAAATINLPDGASYINTSCYTGTKGSTENNCSMQEIDNLLFFTSNSFLSDNEGFTIAVSFPRDIIKRPPPPTFLEQHKQFIGGTIALIIMLIFYIITWVKLGIDPKKPIVIPTFKPPHGWSPAVVNYIYNLKYNGKAFTAALINMAVKRVIRINNKKRDYSLEITGDPETLNSEEKIIFNTLFEGKKTITVSNVNHIKFSNATTKFNKELSDKWKISDYIKKNNIFVAIAYFFTLAIITLDVYLSDFEPFIILPFAIFTMLLSLPIHSIKNNSGRIALFVFTFALFSFASILEFFIINQYNIFSIIFRIVVFVSFSAYIYLIKAPTKLGAKTNAELEGFRMYLKTGEENRLNLLTPPEMTPELFEKLLPYAVALNVENEWAKKFNNVLTQLNYNPDWYVGNKSFIFSAIFINSLSRSFNSSLQSSRIPPSTSSSSGGRWSSGSGGGGFSGGGGGGGGGGGW